MKGIDLTGRRYGRLTVIGEAAKLPGNSNRRWLCRCECGKEAVVFGANLQSGHTTSCGCYRSIFDIAMNTTHGKTYDRLYRLWSHMKERCNNPQSRYFHRYGARGIKVCPEWADDFQAFYDWAMSHGYADNLTIDRIDNDGDYTPENCRWATKKIQNNNTSKNVTYTVNGITRTQRGWEEALALPRGKLWKIKRAGKNVETFIMDRMEGQR